MKSRTVEALKGGSEQRSCHRFRAKLLALTLGAGLCATMTFSAAAQTQEQAGNSDVGMGMHGHHKMPSVDDQVKRMTKKLNLNDDQQSKVRSALESQQAQMQQLRSDTSLSRDDRMSKMQEIHQNSTTQIRAALNDDQQKKFDEMQEKRRERMSHRKGMSTPDNQQQAPQSN